jgi:N-acetylglucosaminyldiphosphoundecaprenol N-acetyl-beta-D-mannosaminyltransferase
VIDRGEKNLLGVLLNAVDYEAAVDQIISAARERRSFAVTALAVHGVMCGALDAAQRHRLNAFDLRVPDGQPVRWGLNLLHGARLADRVYGPTLMLRICERAAQERLPIYLYGSRASVLEALRRALRERFPALQIVGAEPSRFRRVTAEEQREIARTIAASGARLTFVGLGCPRQEVWAYENRPLIPMPLIAVGAAFDFHAGGLRQAPALLQRAGLEWLFRLVMEPRRLWRRYLLLNPYYLILLGLQAAGLRRVAPSDGSPSPEPMFYA